PLGEDRGAQSVRAGRIGTQGLFQIVKGENCHQRRERGLAEEVHRFGRVGYDRRAELGLVRGNRLLHSAEHTAALGDGIVDQAPAWSTRGGAGRAWDAIARRSGFAVEASASSAWVNGA